MLDDRSRRSVYLSEGLAHGFQALYQDSTVMYLCSSGYDPDREHTILATDPALDIHWPGTDHVLSDRDAHAPSLEKVKAAGLLPTWEEAKAFVEDLRGRDAVVSRGLLVLRAACRAWRAAASTGSHWRPRS